MGSDSRKKDVWTLDAINRDFCISAGLRNKSVHVQNITGMTDVDSGLSNPILYSDILHRMEYMHNISALNRLCKSD